MRDLELGGQAVVVFEAVRDHEGVHAGADRGLEILVLVAADIGARRVDAELFARGAELGGLLVLERDVDQEIELGNIDIVAQEQLAQGFERFDGDVAGDDADRDVGGGDQFAQQVGDAVVQPGFLPVDVGQGIDQLGEGNSFRPPIYLSSLCRFWNRVSSPIIRP